MAASYRSPGPTREEVDASEGPLLLEFGTDWCGICQGAASTIAKSLQDFPDVPHIKVEDGPGRRLGRSFTVKLWPTLIFLRDGVEIARAVRPNTREEIVTKLDQISGETSA